LPGARAIFEAVKSVNDFRNTRVAHQEKPLANPDETKTALLKWVETLALLWQENADTIYARKCVVTLAGVTPKAQAAGEVRYSPAQCMGAKKTIISGQPDYRHVSTSYTERQNLTMRMSMRRFTRLTNGFSKKLENHEAAIALHYMHYNFARIHQSLRVTPAMAANVSDHVWSLEEIVNLLD